MTTRLFLVEEVVIKEACNLKPKSPIWHWFDVEGPIIRAMGVVSPCGRFVAFKHFDLVIVIDRELVEELEDAD